MDKLLETKILDILPYRTPFRFVDMLTKADGESFEGIYTFKSDEFFYKGHFPDYPVTPGVILIETMAQIGLVSFGIFLLLNEEYEFDKGMSPIFTSSNVEFLMPVFPGDTVTVRSKKEFFRLGKLKCHIEMTHKNGDVVSKGYLSGIFLRAKI